MAQGHGGYRRPTNPAPVSGPGAHSRRTDGRQPVMDLPNAQYGENAQYRELENSAKLPQNRPAAPAPTPVGASGPMAQPGVVPLGAPSMQPNVPVTAGASYGAGPGTSALGIVSPAMQDSADFAKYMPVLIDIAQRDDTPGSVKQLVRRLIAYS